MVGSLSLGVLSGDANFFTRMATAVTAKRIVTRTPTNRRRGKTDWARFDALTDRDIATAVKSDPDVMPILRKKWFKSATIVMPEQKVPIFVADGSRGRRTVQDSGQALSVARGFS